MKTSFDQRHQSRILVLQKLFADSFNEEVTSDHADSFENKFEHITSIRDKAPKYNKQLAQSLLGDMSSHMEEIDGIVQKYATERPINQIAKIDLHIMRIAILEGFILNITPPKVAIDEAIELGKEFGGSSKFINGVLGKLLEDSNLDE